jgi:putative acetyltransferase
VTKAVDIRASLPGDRAAIEAVYREAFPEEDLLPLVRDLLRETQATLSLVASLSSSLVAHVVFTDCEVPGHLEKAALLGPLAVAPAAQRQGIGGAILREGLKRLERAGVAQVFVLGDPAYYRRFGFVRECSVAPPYALPPQWKEAWQSKRLHDGTAPLGGELSVPRPWRRPALWAP